MKEEDVRKQESVGERLKKKGLKNTRHRQEILKTLQESSQPLSAEAIYIELRGRGCALNLSTVYRTLGTLAAKELVSKTEYGDKALFEISNAGHGHHFVCLGCNRMIRIEECPLSEYENKLQNEFGFSVTDHKLELYGFCRQCQKKSK